MKKAIHTDNAPAAIGPYSQAIQAGNLVFLSGQIPLVPASMELVEGDFEHVGRIGAGVRVPAGIEADRGDRPVRIVGRHVEAIAAIFHWQ